MYSESPGPSHIMVHECKNAMWEQSARNRDLLPETEFASSWVLSQNIQQAKVWDTRKDLLFAASKENTRIAP